jgi:TonB family protein
MNTKGLLIAAAVGVFFTTTGHATEQSEPRCTVEPPKYPYAARRDWTSGTAVVAITVAADGAVQSTSLRKSSGTPYLDAVSVESAAAASCTRGQPETVTQTYHFNLKPPGSQRLKEQ